MPARRNTGVKPKSAAPQVTDDEPCVEHFPLGWETAHIHPTHVAVSCEHGEWRRAAPGRSTVDVPRAVAEDTDDAETDHPDDEE